jgi:hypothetical protein
MRIVLLEYYCKEKSKRVIWPETLSSEEAIEKGRTLEEAVVLTKKVKASSFELSSFEKLPL